MRRLAALTIAVVALIAVAMHITNSVSLLTWSADGLSALVAYDAQGPEGGGSVGYGVVTCAGVQARVTLSSNFSPGGSSRPQRVTEQACRDGLAKLGAALETSGFKGVTLTPDDCKTRSGMVNAKEAGSAPGGWTFTKQGTTLVINEGKKKVLEVPNASSASVSPTGRAILVMSEDESDERIVGLWTRSAAGAFVRCAAD